MLPQLILEDIAWSFKEPVPASSSDLIKAVTGYYRAVFDKVFKQKLLTARSPLYRLDVAYTYAIEKPGKNEWDDVIWEDFPMVIRIDGGGKLLTYADILWQIHKAAHPYLKNQDHHYFEGLAALSKPLKRGVAAYEMWLGS